MYLKVLLLKFDEIMKNLSTASWVLRSWELFSGLTVYQERVTSSLLVVIKAICNERRQGGCDVWQTPVLFSKELIHLPQDCLVIQLFFIQLFHIVFLIYTHNFSPLNGPVMCNLLPYFWRALFQFAIRQLDARHLLHDLLSLKLRYCMYNSF